jgi:hypothetical protein
MDKINNFRELITQGGNLPKKKGQSHEKKDSGLWNPGRIFREVRDSPLLRMAFPPLNELNFSGGEGFDS